MGAADKDSQKRPQLNTLAVFWKLSLSLHIFVHEAMALVNSRPLTIDNLNDPNSLEPPLTCDSP